MGKSKIDFISDLLASKRLDSSMKQKFFELAALELRNIEYSDAKILNEIELIKNKIGLQETQSNKVKESHSNSTLPKYKNPREISEFLLSYNQNIILKSTTHNVDTNLLISINDFLNTQEYTFAKHLDAIKTEFSKLTKEYSISKNLFAKISAYINGTNLWSENKIGISWSSQELYNWAQLNPGNCPNPERDLGYEPFKFDKVRLNNGSILKDFQDLTMFFKKQLTIRSDNNLYDLCREWNFLFRDKVTFVIETQNIPRNIEFFTDIEKLQQAYKEIIDLCIDESGNNNGAKPEIQIGLKETKNESQETIIVFSIWHKNSKFNKTVDATLTRYGKSFSGLITNQINGLCDWELKADFGNNTFAKVSLWPQKKEVETLNNFEGVQFNLIFYR